MPLFILDDLKKRGKQEREKMITEQAKLTDVELMDSLNAKIRTNARWDINEWDLKRFLEKRGVIFTIPSLDSAGQPNGEEGFYEPSSKDINEYVKVKAEKAYDSIYSQIATDENLLKGIRAVGETFNVDYVYRILRDAWDNEYFENKTVVDFVFESANVKNMVDKAMDDILSEGGPGSGPQGGSGKRKNSG
jgi:hypothetical protein